jgi:GNAT superfamily N-acetyltransferase
MQQAGTLEVRKVTSRADFKTFLEFPWTVYKGDPNWVPPLLSTRRGHLDKTQNPAWEYMEGDYFIAWRGAQPVGTIAAFVNHHHNEYWKERIGWFGMFECLNDPEAASALLQTAKTHVRSLGSYTGIRGPANLTTTDECALLIENFSRPVVLMAYNPPYYQSLIENSGQGFVKCMDLYSWYSNPDMISEGGGLPPKLVRVVEKTRTRNRIVLRKPQPGKLKQEIGKILDLYDTAWAENWGFYPPTQREADKLYKDMKQFVDLDLVHFAQIDGQDIGFLLALPDMNQALHLAYPHPGEPELWTLLKVFWHWKIRPKITGQRIIFMGVKPEHRGKGVEAALCLAFFEEGVRYRKYYDSDAGWVLETNQPMNQLSQTFNAKLYKRYRFYEAALTDPTG